MHQNNTSAYLNEGKNAGGVTLLISALSCQWRYLSPRPTQGLPSPIQDLLKPNHSLACQLGPSLVSKGRLYVSTGPFESTKGPLMATLDPTRKTHDPFKTDGAPSWTKNRVKSNRTPKTDMGITQANTLSSQTNTGPSCQG